VDVNSVNLEDNENQKMKTDVEESRLSSVETVPKSGTLGTTDSDADAHLLLLLFSAIQRVDLPSCRFLLNGTCDVDPTAGCDARDNRGLTPFMYAVFVYAWKLGSEDFGVMLEKKGVAMSSVVSDMNAILELLVLRSREWEEKKMEVERVVIVGGKDGIADVVSADGDTKSKKKKKKKNQSKNPSEAGQAEQASGKKSAAKAVKSCVNWSNRTGQSAFLFACGAGHGDLSEAADMDMVECLNLTAKKHSDSTSANNRVTAFLEYLVGATVSGKQNVKGQQSSSNEKSSSSCSPGIGLNLTPFASDDDHWGALFYAVQSRNLPAVKFLHRRFPQFSKQVDRWGHSPLYYAVLKEDLEVAKELLRWDLVDGCVDQNGDRDLYQLLRHLRIKVNVTDDYVKTLRTQSAAVNYKRPQRAHRRRNDQDGWISPLGLCLKKTIW